MATSETLNYPSHDKASTIHAVLWEPSDPSAARGVVQLVHGMSEYVERYADFARYLNGRGFVVCANDHIGHGKSVSCAEEWGDLPLHGGADILVEDVHSLRGLVQQRYPDVPYFLFGHSMGSFVVRAYLARHGKGLAGAVVCGTSQQPAPFVAKAGGALARILAAIHGRAYRSALLDGMGSGGYGKRVENARTPFDWLNTDPARVDEYIDDEACGFIFSVGGYATLTDLCAQALAPACAAATPDDLPVLFIAGDGDPVGDFGTGVRAAAQQMADKSKARVGLKIYPGMRHEILNEPQHETVYADVDSFLEACLKGESWHPTL